jgi:hypothetical protein
MGEVTVGDVRVAYDVQGCDDAGAPLLVLIHGTTQDRTGWATITPALASTNPSVKTKKPRTRRTYEPGAPQ